MYILDTNAVSALMKGSPAVVDRLAALAPDEVAIPQPVIAKVHGIGKLRISVSATSRSQELHAAHHLCPSCPA